MRPDGGGSSAPMDTAVGFVLLGGVTLSAALLAAALVWQWAATGSAELAFRFPAHTLVAFIASSGRGLGGVPGPQFLSGLGLAVLMLTPYVRVLVSIAFFAFVERDWKYVIFTTFVASVLTYSLFLR